MKKFVKVITVGLSFIMSISIGNIARAADADTLKTKAVFILEGGTEDNKPTNPIIPIDPPTNHTGNLVIDAVSDFTFGNGKIESKTVTYNAVIPTDKTLGTQVTDMRGTGAGWDLTAKISDFENADKTKILKGAQLLIPAGSVSTTSISKDNPAISKSVTLNETEQSIFSASQDSGMGTWSTDFEGNGSHVSIVVPDGNYADSYSAEIVWSLQDAPK